MYLFLKINTYFLGISLAKAYIALALIIQHRRRTRKYMQYCIIMCKSSQLSCFLLFSLAHLLQPSLADVGTASHYSPPYTRKYYTHTQIYRLCVDIYCTYDPHACRSGDTQ